MPESNVTADSLKKPPTAPTLRDIAKKTGYSLAAVSAALRGLPTVSVETRQKICAEAEKMGYHSDVHLQMLMTYMRSRQGKIAPCNIGWLHANTNENDALLNTRAQGFYAGALRRAEEIGFSVDLIWIGKYAERYQRLQEVLINRGITGLIIAPPWREGFKELLDWDKFSIVSVDESHNPPGFHRIFPDYYADMRLALANAKLLGYSRPAFWQSKFMDMVNDGRFTAAYLYTSSCSPQEKQMRLLPEENRKHWILKTKPDVIITTERTTLEELRAMNIRVPEDVALIHLNVGVDVPDWAGMIQDHLTIGARAVELLANALNHHERGLPAKPMLTMIEGAWQDGWTAPKKN